MSHSITKYKAEDLQRLHEVNYHLLMRLVPCLHGITDVAVSMAHLTANLYLHIHERTPYTTVLSLTHQIEIGDSSVPAPDLWLRVYHDACVAEAIAQQDGAGPAHSRDYSLQLGLDSDIKWKLNQFMEKWLKNCIELGHVFDEDSILEASEAVSST